MSSLASQQGLSLSELLKAQWRVLLALMLRDIKTRFTGGYWGFVVMILWPLSHSFIITMLSVFAGRTAPYGESTALWFATGTVPAIAFMYMARFTMMGIIMNRPLMGFPVVKVTDILFARALLEILCATLVILLTMMILAFMGVDFMPLDTVQACSAVGGALLLGFGFGILNAILAGAFNGWVFGYVLFQLSMWFASGVMFVPESLPEVARYWLSFNPLLHLVLWMRSAYFEGYGSLMLDRAYVLEWGLTSTAAGLLLERLIRGRLMR